MDASSVAHGHAVVLTPHCGSIRNPAGPSAVVMVGMAYSGIFPIPKVLDTPVFGCPPSRCASSSSVICARNSSRLIFPSATSVNGRIPSLYLHFHRQTGSITLVFGVSPSSGSFASNEMAQASVSTGSVCGSSSNVPSDNIRFFNTDGTSFDVSCSTILSSSSVYTKSACMVCSTDVPT